MRSAYRPKAYRRIGDPESVRVIHSNAKLYYHVVWTTKQRFPLITSSLEAPLRKLLEQKGESLGVKILECNMVTDHLHAVLELQPTHSIAKVIGQLKGFTAHEVNRLFETHEFLRWSRGYGARTVSEKQLPLVIKYVQDQKKRQAGMQRTALKGGSQKPQGDSARTGLKAGSEGPPDKAESLLLTHPAYPKGVK